MGDRRVLVRRLLPGEASQFHRLNHLFEAAFEEVGKHGAARPSDAYLEEILGKPHVIAVVAFDDEAIVGGLVAYVLEKFEQARREIYIYDLAVDRPYRRDGIATALIGHLRRIAGEIGAYVIYFQADLGDEPAIALYTKLGRREDVLHFDIDVSGPEGD